MAKRENRRDYYMVKPEDLKIQDDPKGKFYDERVNLPLIEETVLNIMAIGVLDTIIAISTDDGDFVVSGRQRTKHAIEANKRLVARGDSMIMVPVRFARDGESIPLFEIALNEHRQDDSPMVKIGKAMALRDKYSDDQIAAAFRVTPGQVKNWARIDSVPSLVKRMIDNGKIAATAAAKFAHLPSEEQIEKVRGLIDSGAKPTVQNAAKAAKGHVVKKKGLTKAQLKDYKHNPSTPPHFVAFIKLFLGELDFFEVEKVEGLEWLK